MKQLIAAVALLAITSVHAQDLKFGDLNYFLKQGQKNIVFDTIVNNEETRANKTNDIEIDAYFFNTTFAYATSDSFNLTLGLDYIYHGRTSIDGSSYITKGFQNPKLGVNYRLIKQADSGFNLDLGAVASFKISERKLGDNSPEEDGNTLNQVYSNYAEPRNTLDLNARLGKKWNSANEFYLNFGLAKHMSGSFYSHDTDEDVDVESSTDYKISAFYQYRPVNPFMMNVGLIGTKVSDRETKEAGVKSNYTDHTDYQFQFNAKYLINDEFIAKFMFSEDRRDNFSEDKAGNTKFDKRHALAYGLGVDFLF